MAVTMTASYDDVHTTALLAVNNADAVLHSIAIQRTANVGESQYVRGARNVNFLAHSAHTVVDTEAPVDIAFAYQLWVDGVMVQQLAAHTYTAPFNAEGFPTWAILRHLQYPDLSHPVLISEMGDTDRPAAFGDFTPVGGGLPVVVTSLRRGRRGTMSLITLGDAAAQAMVDVFADGSVLQLATSPYFHVGNNGYYFACSGLSNSRVTENGTDPARVWSVDYIEVAAPVASGVLVALNTYNDLVTYFTNYTDLLNAGLTYRSVIYLALA